jgi:hypothetical protein
MTIYAKPRCFTRTFTTVARTAAAIAYNHTRAIIWLSIAFLLPCAASASTISVTASGPDDSNTTTLTPWKYITASSVVDPTKWINKSFNNDMWKFSFADGTDTPFVPKGDFKVNQYDAWAVNDLPIRDLAGDKQGRPVNDADAGGANFELTYTPRANSTDPKDVHFLQVYHESINGGAGRDNVDNVGGKTTPFYDACCVSGFLPNKNASWMLDIPYTCENGFTGDRDPVTKEPTCQGGQDEVKLSESDYFQTFVALDNVVNGTHNVTLYGGISWGYVYTNTDTPEPASLLLIGSGLIALGAMRRRTTQSNTVSS